jgi:hypothetical protein
MLTVHITKNNSRGTKNALAVVVLFFYLTWAQEGLKINEIFPRAQQDEPEWIELVNTSDTTISIINYSIGTALDSGVISQDSIFIQPGGYIIITKNKTLFSERYSSVSKIVQPASWHALDNYNDTLRLWDNYGRLVDTVAYHSSWFTLWDQQSIERISFSSSGFSHDSWVLSQNSSPGRPNSSILFRNGGPSIEIGPTLFTPNNDGKDDLLSIKPVFPASYSLSVSIYGFNGKKYLDLPVTAQPQYLWDGNLASGAQAPAGPFFVVAAFKISTGTVIVRKKGILWR